MKLVKLETAPAYENFRTIRMLFFGIKKSQKSQNFDIMYAGNNLRERFCQRVE